MKTTPFLSSVMSVLAAFALLASFGVSAQTWVGGTGTWDDTTTANWSPANVPTDGSTVNLTQSSAANLAIGYTATNLTDPPGLVRLNIGNTGGGTTTLSLDGTDSLPTQGFVLNPGGAVNMTGGTLGVATATASSISQLNGGTFTISGGTWLARIPANGALQVGHAAATGPAVLNLEGGGIAVAGSSEQNLNVGGHATHTAELNQSGGTMTVPFFVRINNNGTYNLSNGTLSSSRALQVNSGGTFTQSGGTASLAGVTVSGGTLNLSGGTFTPASPVSIHSNGEFNWTGANDWSTRTLWIGWDGSTATSGTLTLKTANTLTVNSPAGGGTQVIISQYGILQGYGIVKDFRLGQSSPTNFENNGRVIANGYGQDRTLNLSQFDPGKITNTIDNPTTNGDNGWFAVNQGKLLLPNIAVTDATASYNWGEAAADTTIDLVNSAQFTFSGHGAGTLSGALLAVDRTDVPAFDTGMRHQGLISIHDFNLDGTSFDSFDLTIRYDDALAAASEFEDVLQIFHYTGGAWVPLDSTADTLNKWVTASGIPSMSLFGVGYAIPEPTSALLLGLAGLALLKRACKRH